MIIIRGGIKYSILYIIIMCVCVCGGCHGCTHDQILYTLHDHDDQSGNLQYFSRDNFLLPSMRAARQV